MTRRINLKDVAAEAGVSYQTVSKVLNGTANVTAETATRVWAAANKLGYRPNVSARSLRKRASHLIGYSWKPVPPDQVSPILDKFLSSTVEAAEEAGYHLMLFPMRGGQDGRDQYRELISTGRVDGFILSSTNYDDPRIRVLADLKFPFVMFGRSNDDWDFPFVDVDGRAGTRMATQHLIAQAHRRIALLAWPDQSRTGTARYNGYIEAMETANLPIDPAWIRRGEGHFDSGFQHVLSLLALPEERRPTAVVAVDDQLAIGAIRAAQQSGVAIGAEFGIIGFDDTPGIQLLNPSLTSIRQPIREVGRRIIQLLTTILEGKQPAERHILLQPELIVRQSSLRDA